MRIGAAIFWVLCLQVPHLFEVEDCRDEPVAIWDKDPKSYGHLLHYYTTVSNSQA